MRMKRKVYISCLTVRLGLFFLLAFTPWLLLHKKTTHASCLTVYA